MERISLLHTYNQIKHEKLFSIMAQTGTVAGMGERAFKNGKNIKLK